MPYIPQSERKQFDKGLNQLKPQTKGQLTYCLFNVVLDYLQREPGIKYESLSNAISALKDAEHELRRRFLYQSEDAKRKAHGCI